MFGCLLVPLCLSWCGFWLAAFWGVGFIAPCIWVLSVRFALGCYDLCLVVFVGLVGLVLGVC